MLLCILHIFKCHAKHITVSCIKNTKTYTKTKNKSNKKSDDNDNDDYNDNNKPSSLS